MKMWIQLGLLVQVLVVLAQVDSQKGTSITNDGVNLVCKTPGGSGGFLIDGMDVVSIIKALKVCRFGCFCGAACIGRMMIA